MPDDDLVDARFIPGDKTATFSIRSTHNPDIGFIKYGDVIKLPRSEALDSENFEIVEAPPQPVQSSLPEQPAVEGTVA